MTPKGQATRFLVWRAYHRLKAELGRVPYCGEVAEETGISVPHVKLLLRSIKSCPPHRNGEDTSEVLAMSGHSNLAHGRNSQSRPVDTYFRTSHDLGSGSEE